MHLSGVAHLRGHARTAAMAMRCSRSPRRGYPKQALGPRADGARASAKHAAGGDPASSTSWSIRSKRQAEACNPAQERCGPCRGRRSDLGQSGGDRTTGVWRGQMQARGSGVSKSCSPDGARAKSGVLGACCTSPGLRFAPSGLRQLRLLPLPHSAFNLTDRHMLGHLHFKARWSTAMSATARSAYAVQAEGVNVAAVPTTLLVQPSALSEPARPGAGAPSSSPICSEGVEERDLVDEAAVLITGYLGSPDNAVVVADFVERALTRGIQSCSISATP